MESVGARTDFLDFGLNTQVGGLNFPWAVSLVTLSILALSNCVSGGGSRLSEGDRSSGGELFLSCSIGVKPWRGLQNSAGSSSPLLLYVFVAIGSFIAAGGIDGGSQECGRE